MVGKLPILRNRNASNFRKIVKKKITEIKNVLYAVYNISCEPTKEEIEKAVREKDFEVRAFQKDLAELNTEWNKNAENRKEEYCLQQRRFHIRRIAYFVLYGWKEPILLCEDGCTVLDGLHRLKAAIHLSLEEVEVIVT